MLGGEPRTRIGSMFRVRLVVAVVSPSISGLTLIFVRNQDETPDRDEAPDMPLFEAGRMWS